MIRCFIVSIAVFAWLGLAVDARLSTRQSKDDQPESRSAIIERIKANQERVRKLLADQNSGAETRKLQRAIADDLGKLLEEPPDDSPSNSSTGRDNPPSARETPKGPESKAAAPLGAEPKATQPDPKTGVKGVTGASRHEMKPVTNSPEGWEVKDP